MACTIEDSRSHADLLLEIETLRILLKQAE